MKDPLTEPLSQREWAKFFKIGRRQTAVVLSQIKGAEKTAAGWRIPLSKAPASYWMERGLLKQSAFGVLMQSLRTEPLTVQQIAHAFNCGRNWCAKVLLPTLDVKRVGELSRVKILDMPPKYWIETGFLNAVIRGDIACVKQEVEQRTFEICPRPDERELEEFLSIGAIYESASKAS